MDRDGVPLVHCHARDDGAFGFAAGLRQVKASDAIEAGRGCCNIKSALLVTLLRAADIPARHCARAGRADTLMAPLCGMSRDHICTIPAASGHHDRQPVTEAICRCGLVPCGSGPNMELRQSQSACRLRQSCR
ncbi:MAG: transglutaminase family protein [Pseudomonadota bacterium]